MPSSVIFLIFFSESYSILPSQEFLFSIHSYINNFEALTVSFTFVSILSNPLMFYPKINHPKVTLFTMSYEKPLPVNCQTEWWPFWVLTRCSLFHSWTWRWATYTSNIPLTISSIILSSSSTVAFIILFCDFLFLFPSLL